METTIQISTNQIASRKVLAALLVAFSLTPACAHRPSRPLQTAAPPERYGHIERFKISSRSTNDIYSIEIYLPATYTASGRAYPALFLLDGEYSFDAAVALSSYMQRDEIAEHVIIGVSYNVPFGAPLAAKRSRDFTPRTSNGLLNRDAPAPYYLFLRDELLPEINRRVRIDAKDKTLWAYSLSGGFLAWLNYYDHELFQNYVAASSNWASYGIPQRLGEGVVFNAPKGRDHKLFVSFDQVAEMPTPEMADQLRKLLDRGMPGYEVKYVFTEGETHTTSWFATMPAALRFIYGRKSPVKS